MTTITSIIPTDVTLCNTISNAPPSAYAVPAPSPSSRQVSTETLSRKVMRLIDLACNGSYRVYNVALYRQACHELLADMSTLWSEQATMFRSEIAKHLIDVYSQGLVELEAYLIVLGFIEIE